MSKLTPFIRIKLPKKRQTRLSHFLKMTSMWLTAFLRERQTAVPWEKAVSPFFEILRYWYQNFQEKILYNLSYESRYKNTVLAVTKGSKSHKTWQFSTLSQNLPWEKAVSPFVQPSLRELFPWGNFFPEKRQ